MDAAAFEFLDQSESPSEAACRVDFDASFATQIGTSFNGTAIAPENVIDAAKTQAITFPFNFFIISLLL